MATTTLSRSPTLFIHPARGENAASVDRHMKARGEMPGPSRLQLLLSLPGLLRNPLSTFLAWHGRYGDTITVPIRHPATLHVSNPEDIRHILAVNPLNYRKTGALIIGRRLLGQGLLASSEPLHQHQRRIAQPHFLRQAVSAFALMMEEATSRHMGKWEEGTVIDIFPEMTRLTITIIGRAYFSSDLSGDSEQLYCDFGICQKFMQKLVNIPNTYPTPLNRRYREAVRRIDGIIDRIISERLSSKDRPPDLLTALIEAKDHAGQPLTRRQIRDEMVGILLAGHETTAIALSWTLYFLSENPEVERRFHQELSSTLGDQRANAENTGNLRFAEMILNESMRLRPPVWILARMASNDDLLPSGRTIPAGTEVLMLPYIAHRNPDFFPDPEKFIPERFSEDPHQARPSFVYFPFGGGPRGCIGENFARMEALIILATVGRNFRLRLVPGHPVVPEPLVTLRPKHGIRMEVLRHRQTSPRPSVALHSGDVSLRQETQRV